MRRAERSEIVFCLIRKGQVVALWNFGDRSNVICVLGACETGGSDADCCTCEL